MTAIGVLLWPLGECKEPMGRTDEAAQLTSPLAGSQVQSDFSRRWRPSEIVVR
jgi:hypothetical protein